MARAAVRAKQAQAAQAQAAARPRRDRRHASGGNPNQDLFFMRIRRKQKWIFLVLAVMFAATFALLGVGSGSGGGLQQVWNGLLGGSGDAVSKAQAEIKTDPAKGYRDLANAYVSQSNLAGAITAMQSYLALKKTDALGWTQLGGYYQQQAQTYSTQYQQALQSSQLQTPSSVIAPTGKLSGIFGTNPVEQSLAQQSSTQISPLYQQATTAYNGALNAFQNAAKYSHSKDSQAAAWYQAFTEASYAGNKAAALSALQHYVQLTPTVTGLKQIEGICKSLGGTCVPKTHAKKK